MLKRLVPILIVLTLTSSMFPITGLAEEQFKVQTAVKQVSAAKNVNKTVLSAEGIGLLNSPTKETRGSADAGIPEKNFMTALPSNASNSFATPMDGAGTISTDQFLKLFGVTSSDVEKSIANNG